jgi:para-aminobenzoate synthetase / 4-amino-4-deoxychorismate lyase
MPVTRWTQLPQQFHAVAAEHPNSVLLQTARFDAENQRSLLFINPLRTISASQLDELPELFHQIEAAGAEGHHVAGFLGYECGYHFEPIGAPPLEPQELPLVWFGVYRDPVVFDHVRGCIEKGRSLPLTQSSNEPPLEHLADQVSLQRSAAEYAEKIRRIKDYIRAGDTYQVNFTDCVELTLPTTAAEAFTGLLRHQPVAYSAFLNLPTHQILSLSPELFFRIENGKITTRPMKGTMPRGLTVDDDRQAATKLQQDEKNRSEHLMIVDLLRNDLGRICEMGSVKVEDLFTVETYQTLLQMTSTISGSLRPGLTCYDIFRGMFPSGSITGAPKIRTMQIIRELEQRPRGVYTGSIGYIAPSGNAAFNVAIRTLVAKDHKAVMGVGGGIVADSDPAEEYRECLLKASFLTRQHRPFQLIETMLWDGGLVRLSLHLDRLESSASYFGFACDREEINSQLNTACAALPSGTPHRVRLLLNEAGLATITVTEIKPSPFSGRVRLSPHSVSSSDLFLRHKTTRRELYNQEYAAAQRDGFDEVIFLNERGEVTEGAISNLFLRQGDKLLTPPLNSGVLAGVLRRHILETEANAEERVLTLSDLERAEAVYIGNSLRGLRRITILELRPASNTESRPSAKQFG